MENNPGILPGNQAFQTRHQFFCEEQNISFVPRPGVRFSKDPKTYRPEKPFVKLRPAYFVKLVFAYVGNGIKIKITAKFRDKEHFRFKDTKRIISPETFPDFREINCNTNCLLTSLGPYCDDLGPIFPSTARASSVSKLFIKWHSVSDSKMPFRWLALKHVRL